MNARSGVALSSAGTLQGGDDCRLISGDGGLQRGSAAPVRCIRIGAGGQQHIDRARLTAQHREHQCGAAVFVARVDGRLPAKQHLQPRNVAGFSRTAQLRHRVR